MPSSDPSHSSPPVIVSACLAGVHCRYDCASKAREEIVEMVARGQAIPVCPEQLGGLPTPRAPAEITPDGRVLTIDGQDVTLNYERGAQEALRIAQIAGAKKAVLKSKSPMCGVDETYDGSFTSRLKNGDGVFAQLLRKMGLQLQRVD